MPSAAAPRDATAGSVAVFAPAKINLWLHVVGRRDDGLHLLDSLVAFAAVGDTVTAAPAEDLSLAIDGPFAAALTVEPQDDNLALRAARLLAAAAGVEAGARLALTKRLPIGAGIGGGSADAAATLTACARLWGIDIGARRMAELALALGADVPVCLAGRPARVGGIGEAVAPVADLPPAPLLLVNPGVPLMTAAVFRARAASGAGFGVPAAPWAEAPADAVSLADRLRETRNDLTDAARALAPAIGEVRAAIESQPNCLLARMSGSGATCFGLFATTDAAEAAAAALRAARPDWWVTATRLRTGIEGR